MADIWDTEIIPNITWEDHIQHFFTDRDIQCMNGQGIPLGNYESVRFFARRIYGVTKAGTMPIGGVEVKWNEYRLENFRNWIANGSPLNAEDDSLLEGMRISLVQDQTFRVRKNLADIDPGSVEMDRLRDAFRGLIARESTEPDSYFQLAGLHWLPAPATYCVHGEDRYNPWHRVYLLVFENALRSVPGCEDVTLPFWDIASGEIPDVLYEEPFNKYTYQIDVKGLNGTIAAYAGESTSRFDKATLLANVNRRTSRLKENVDLALGADTWLGFNGLPPFDNNIIQAHNTGHGDCGDTLAIPDTAAFDPLFWFFHCNWDRLWWQWQRNANVQRLSDFRNLLASAGQDDDWLNDPVIGLLEPFAVLSEATIDSIELNVDYELPPAPETAELFSIWTPSRMAHEVSQLAETDKVQVRLESFDRLSVKGSVNLELLADGEIVSTHYIFQSTEPRQCPTCQKHGTVSIDFEVERNLLENRQLKVRVICVGAKGAREELQLQDCGSPTLSIRLPLDRVIN